MKINDDLMRYVTSGVEINAAGFRSAIRGEGQGVNPYNHNHWDGQAWLDGWEAGNSIYRERCIGLNSSENS